LTHQPFRFVRRQCFLLGKLDGARHFCRSIEESSVTSQLIEQADCHDFAAHHETIVEFHFADVLKSWILQQIRHL
jgi:hypothetical protein